MNTATCGMSRFHPYLASSAPSRSCVREDGHDGLCSDGWGGQFQGVRPRPRALTPEEVDTYNRPNDDVEKEEAVTSYDVAYVPDVEYRPEEVDGEPVMYTVYDSQTTDLLGTLSANDDLTRWLAVTPDGGQGPLCGSVEAGGQWLAAYAHDPENAAALVTDALVAKLGKLLATPGTLRTASEKLNAADSAFGRLDLAMRNGGRKPARWRPLFETSDEDYEPGELVTHLYDSLSAALRITGGASTCLGTLRNACRLWSWFDAALSAESPVPEPWRP